MQGFQGGDIFWELRRKYSDCTAATFATFAAIMQTQVPKQKNHMKNRTPGLIDQEGCTKLAEPINGLHSARPFEQS